MDIEYEATFPNIDKADVRRRLNEASATLIRPEFLQRRVVFHLPEGHAIPGGWLRVRDEGDKVTMSLKIVAGDRIEDQKEVMVTVSHYDQAVLLLTSIGCKRKSYQETKRELWRLDDCEVTLDEWPYLEPFVEIEGPNEAAVRSASSKLGFEYETAVFGAVDVLYAKKYSVSEDVINNRTPEITFTGSNPFRPVA